jgi:phage terminase large subunit GpA-like protein
MIESFKKSIQAPSELHPADWANLHVCVENSERGEKFDAKQTRWWRKPMGHYADYVTTNMVCIMPTGAGKSTFFEAINCWIVSEAPGSVLYASQTNSDAELWCETRFLKAARRCKPLDHLWPTNIRNSVRKDAIVWPHMFMVVGGANVSNFQEKSISYGQGDEAWQWKHGLVGDWLARSHNRENRKFVLTSQAGEIAHEDDKNGKTSELHVEHDKCRKWDFGWRCSSCGEAHVYKFEQLIFDNVNREDGTLDEQATADTVRRVCPACSAEYADTAEIRRKLHDSLQENDGYICVDPNGQRGYEGFHVDRGAIWWCSWKDDVLKKMLADKYKNIGDHTKIKEWMQKDRAIGWTDSVAIDTITLALSGYTAGDYLEARKIDEEQIRFATIDAGADHFWLNIRAWTSGGESRLLYFAYIPTASEVDAIRERYGVEPRHTFLDIGFEQELMAGYIVKYGWQGIKGDGNKKDGWEWLITQGPRKGYNERRLFSKRGFILSKEKQQAVFWFMATTPLQYILERLIRGLGAKWEKYDDTPPSYLKQLNGEKLVRSIDTSGREIEKWKRYGANHARDTEVMQLCAAIMFKVFKPEATVND